VGAQGQHRVVVLALGLLRDGGQGQPVDRDAVALKDQRLRFARQPQAGGQGPQLKAKRDAVLRDRLHGQQRAPEPQITHASPLLMHGSNPRTGRNMKK